VSLVYAVFIGLVLAAWSIAEAGVALGVENEHLSQALAVALWAASWYMGYRIAMPYTQKAPYRRRLLAVSIALIIASLALSRADGVPAGLASYAGLTLATAVSVSVVTSSVYRDRFHEEWRLVIPHFKAFTGIFQTLTLIALSLASLGDPLTALTVAIVLTGLLALARIRDAPIPTTLLWLSDKISETILNPAAPKPSGGDLSRLASLLGVLAVLKFIVMPEALKTHYYLALIIYAASMAVGAWLAAKNASPGLGSLLGLAAIVAAWLTGDPVARLAAISMAAGYADSALLVLALERSPRKTPLYVWKALAWIVVSALLVAAFILSGLGSPFLAAGLVALAALLLYRRRGGWEAWGEPG